MPFKRKIRQWSHDIIQTRQLSTHLNKLSADGYTVFTVNQSSHIGGSYEVLYYIDKPPVPEIPNEEPFRVGIEE